MKPEMPTKEQNVADFVSMWEKKKFVPFKSNSKDENKNSNDLTRSMGPKTIIMVKYWEEYMVWEKTYTYQENKTIDLLPSMRPNIIELFNLNLCVPNVSVEDDLVRYEMYCTLLVIFLNDFFVILINIFFCDNRLPLQQFDRTHSHAGLLLHQ